MVREGQHLRRPGRGLLGVFPSDRNEQGAEGTDVHLRKREAAGVTTVTQVGGECWTPGEWMEYIPCASASGGGSGYELVFIPKMALLHGDVTGVVIAGSGN